MSLLRLVGKVSLPRLREHPLRTSLTIGGVMLGVAVLIAVTLVNRSILKSIRAAVDDISGKADLQITVGSGGLDEHLLEKVREVPGVYKVAPVIQETIRVATNRLDAKRAQLLAHEDLVILGIHLLGDDEYFRSYGSKEIDDIKADPLVFLNSSTNIILSDKFSTKYGFKVHDTIPLITPNGIKDFEIWGFIRDEKLGHAMGGNLSVMYYQAAQVAFGRGSQVDRFDVAVTQGTEVAEVRKQLLSNLGPGYEVDRPERRTDRLSKMIQGFSLALVMGSALTLLLGMFLILNTVSISVLQRKQEIGILRALGATRGQVQNLFILEGVLMGVIGSALGIAVGLNLARLLLTAMTRTVSELYLRIHVDDIQVDTGLILLGATMGIIATLVSSIWPARQATQVSPIETLRMSNTSAQLLSRRGRLLDVVAVALGVSSLVFSRMKPVDNKPLFGYAAIICLMMGFALLMPRILITIQGVLRLVIGRLLGVEGHIANENLSRNVGRVSVTTAALMLAVGTVISFSVLVSSFEGSALKWIDQSIPADLFVSNTNPLSIGTANSHMSNDMYDYFIKLPGVNAVDRMRIIDVNFRDTQIKLLSVDWQVKRKHGVLTYLEGSEEAADVPLFSGTGVLISENLARRYSYRVNDILRLPTPVGIREFKVAGVIIDYTTDQGMVLIHRDIFTKTWQDDLVDTYKIYVNQGTDLEPLRQAISAKFSGQYTLYILSNSELKAEFTKILKQVFQIVYVLQLVALIIAILGVVNTMLAAVLDRVREIGVLRAIGALRWQVRRMIMVEAAIMGLASSFVGLIAGVLSGLIMLYAVNTVQSGWLFPFSMPTLSMIQTSFLVLLAATVAGWYPASIAARIAIVESLKYE